MTEEELAKALTEFDVFRNLLLEETEKLCTQTGTDVMIFQMSEDTYGDRHPETVERLMKKCSNLKGLATYLEILEPAIQRALEVINPSEETK